MDVNETDLGSPSMEDSACSLTIEEVGEDSENKQDVSTKRTEELRLYQSEVSEDPAKPPLQVPVHLFANSSSESKTQENTVFVTHHTPLNTSVTNVYNQEEQDNNGEEKDLNETEIPQLLDSISNSGPHIITIIQDSNDTNELQGEDSVSKEMLKRFVIDAEGIHPSIRPIDVSDSPTIEIFQDKDDDKSLEMETENKLDNHEFELNKQQVVIFSGEHADVDEENITIDSQTSSQPLTITLIEDDNVMSDSEDIYPKRTRLTSENNGFIQDQSDLNLSYELVTEVQSLDGEIVRREVMTQTNSEQKKTSRKRKLKENNDESSPTIRVEIPAKDDWKKYKCSVCSLKFVTEELRDMHVMCHQQSLKNYKCVFCQYTDSQWLKMYNHLFQHGIEKPFKCNKCTFTCINKSDLNAHMAVHSNLKAFSCDKCNRTFKHRRNMIAHMRTCSGLDESGKPQRIEGEEKFICEICKRQLSTKKNLDKHMEIHLDVKPYVCDQCGHSTRLKESLIMHKRIHTGEKPYKCDICGYATPDRSSLRRHKRTHTDDKPYKCQYCNYRSIQKHCLDTHMRRKHTGEQFVCGLCHYATHDRYGLNQHFKRHQNPDGTLIQDVEIENVKFDSKVERITNITIGNDNSKKQTSTYITLPSGLVLKSTEIGKDTVIEESSKEEMLKSQENNKSVFVQIAQQGNTTQNNKKANNTSDNSSKSTDETSENKEEVAILQLGPMEAKLLQQIHQPGDAVFIQETGEIVIRRQDGHLLVIQKQEIELPNGKNAVTENEESQASKSEEHTVLNATEENLNSSKEDDGLILESEKSIEISTSN